MVLSAIEKNEAAYGGGWLIMRREVTVICEGVIAGMWAGPRKSKGMSLSIWGRAFKGNWSSERLRSQKLTTVTQLVHDRARVQIQAASSRARTVGYTVRCLDLSLTIPPTCSPRQWFLCFHDFQRQKSPGLSYTTISDLNCSPLPANRQ